jgi:hypothetical protein
MVSVVGQSNAIPLSSSSQERCYDYGMRRFLDEFDRYRAFLVNRFPPAIVGAQMVAVFSLQWEEDWIAMSEEKSDELPTLEGQLEELSKATSRLTGIIEGDHNNAT